MEKSNFTKGGFFFFLFVAFFIWNQFQDQISDIFSPDPFEAAPRAEIVYYDGYSRENINIDNWEYSPYSEEYEYIVFYGAIAVSTNEFGIWVEDFHDLESAHIAALEWCNSDRYEDEPPCKIVADIIPSAEVDASQLVSGLGALAQNDYASYIAGEDYKVFAISRNGSYGWTWGYETTRTAEKDALEQCVLGLEDIAHFENLDSTCYIFDVNGVLQ